jgi:hypothetical protein
MSKYRYFFICLLLILIPLYPKFPLVGISDTFVAIRLEDLVIAIIIFFYGFNLLIRRFQPLTLPIPRAICLYLFAGFIAVFCGIFLTKTATLNLGLLHFARRIEYMSLFLVAYHWLKNLDQLKYLVRVFLFVSLLVALYGLGQLFFNFPVITTTNSEFSKGLALSLGPGARINSTFAGHYDLAAFCVFPLFILLALLPIVRNKIALFLIGIPLYWVMLLSASRITFFSFFVGASLLFIFIRKKLWIIPLMLISIIGVLLSPQLKGRYLELITNHLRISLVQSVSAQTTSKAVDTEPDALKESPVPEDRSFNIRLKAEWPKAIRAFMKNPILGTGFSSVGLAVDNEYLRILAETGLLGLLSFILIFIRFFKTSLPFIWGYSPTFASAFVIAITCSIASLLLGAVFIDYFAASKIAMITWILAGLAERTKNIP